MLKEGLRRAAVPKARALSPRGAEGPAQAAAGSRGVPSGGGSLQRRMLAGRGVMRPYLAGGHCCDTPYPAVPTLFGVGPPHKSIPGLGSPVKGPY